MVMQWRATRATHLQVGRHRGRQTQLLHPRSPTMRRCEAGAVWQMLISSQGNLRIPLRCANPLLRCSRCTVHIQPTALPGQERVSLSTQCCVLPGCIPSNNAKCMAALPDNRYTAYLELRLICVST